MKLPIDRVAADACSKMGRGSFATSKDAGTTSPFDNPRLR